MNVFHVTKDCRLHHLTPLNELISWNLSVSMVATTFVFPQPRNELLGHNDLLKSNFRLLNVGEHLL